MMRKMQEDNFLKVTASTSERSILRRLRRCDFTGGSKMTDKGRYHSSMKTFDRKAKMDEMEAFDHEGWAFMCSGEQLPSGAFQATVRHKAPPDGQIRTLVLNPVQHATASEALAHAVGLAMKWARERGDDGRGEG